MKKYLLLAICLAVLPTIASCFTLSGAHNRRHLEVFRNQISELHQDIDTVIFGLDPSPSE